MPFLGDDPMTTMIAVGVLALLAVGGALFALFGTTGDDAARKRLRAMDPKAKVANAVASRKAAVEQSAAARLKELEAERKSARNASLRTRLVQAGSEQSPASFMMKFYLAAAGGAAAAYFGSGQLLVAGGVGVVIAFLGPRVVLGNLIERRVMRFLELLPGALDIVVRGVRSGLPVNESLKVVGQEIPDPVGKEFERLVAVTSVGVPLEDALRQMHQRVPTEEVNFLRTVLAIQKQTGGNLAEALGNLSEILRERRKLKLKIKALSSEARMSAIIVGSLPGLVALLVYFLRPDYILMLFTDERGQYMLGIAVVMMIIGILVMRSMVRFKV